MEGEHSHVSNLSTPSLDVENWRDPARSGAAPKAAQLRSSSSSSSSSSSTGRRIWPFETMSYRHRLAFEPGGLARSIRSLHPDRASQGRLKWQGSRHASIRGAAVRKSDGRCGHPRLPRQHVVHEIRRGLAAEQHHPRHPGDAEMRAAVRHELAGQVRHGPEKLGRPGAVCPCPLSGSAADRNHGRLRARAVPAGRPGYSSRCRPGRTW